MKILLAAVLTSSAFAAEFKLPEKFLVFDPSKLHSAVAATQPGKIRPAAKQPLPAVCSHIRVLEVPNDVEPGITLSLPAAPNSRMPVLTSPPTCQTPER